MTDIKKFTDLDAWKVGHLLVLDVYKITASFPDTEKFGLVSQLRRASVSVTSNIAEGFTRFSAQEKVRFYEISIGSVIEVENQIYVARDVGYVTSEIADTLIGRTMDVRKLLFGLIRSIRQ